MKKSSSLTREELMQIYALSVYLQSKKSNIFQEMTQILTK